MKLIKNIIFLSTGIPVESYSVIKVKLIKMREAIEVISKLSTRDKLNLLSLLTIEIKTQAEEGQLTPKDDKLIEAVIDSLQYTREKIPEEITETIGKSVDNRVDQGRRIW